MWIFGGEDPAASKGKSAKSLREENEALKRELQQLRQKAAHGASSSVGQGNAIISPGKPTPQKKGDSPQKLAPSPQKGSPLKTATPLKPAADAVNGALQPAIKVGDIVYVTGLASRPELNGRLARVISHDPGRGTWSAFIEGEPRKFALKLDNLRAPKTPITTFGRSPDAAEGSKASPTKGAARKMQTSRGVGDRKLTAEERDAVQARLYQSKSPPKPKAPKTERVAERSPFEPETSVATIDERPPFVVQTRKRRVHNAPGRTQRAERTNRERPHTNRGSPTTWAAVNRTNWEGRTTSPTGRGHPNQFRRNDLRSADMHTNINYYATSRVPNRASATGDATYTAPDNDRKNKEASWLASQAWFEGLRHYPQGPDAMDSEAAYSGLTHGGGEDAMPTEHLETDLRTRLGIAVADPDWRPAQLQEAWAPENPKLAKRLSELASKLRGVPTDHNDVAPAGHHNGPDLWA